MEVMVKRDPKVLLHAQGGPKEEGEGQESIRDSFHEERLGDLIKTRKETT
jgi:hypothetical protein